MAHPQYAPYQPAAPYFDLVRGALGDRVDGAHFFDVVSEDVVYEVLYDFPGWPRVIRGRADLMAGECSSSNTRFTGPFWRPVPDTTIASVPSSGS